jgi:UDP-glucose 4-epimerase
MFEDKTLLITGGTGSFGNAVLKRFLSTDIREIRVFSRDEKKQDDMRKAFNSTKLKFFVGDVRDVQSLKDAIRCGLYLSRSSAQTGAKLRILPAGGSKNQCAGV